MIQNNYFYYTHTYRHCFEHTEALQYVKVTLSMPSLLNEDSARFPLFRMRIRKKITRRIPEGS